MRPSQSAASVHFYGTGLAVEMCLAETDKDGVFLQSYKSPRHSLTSGGREQVTPARGTSWKCGKTMDGGLAGSPLPPLLILIYVGSVAEGSLVLSHVAAGDILQRFCVTVVVRRMGCGIHPKINVEIEGGSK